MEIDQPIASEPADNDDLRQKVTIAEKALLKSNNSRGLAQRTRKDVLQVLCRDRQLEDTGDKIDLASRLIGWVSIIPLCHTKTTIQPMYSATSISLVMTSNAQSRCPEMFSERTSYRKYGAI